MKRLLIYITAAILYAAGAEAQNMEKLFAEMPDSIVPVMSKTNRLDCIDFFKSKMTGNVQNIFNGRSSISDLDENYLLLKPTSRSLVEMRLYGAGAETKIIAVAYTYMAPARETALAFYTTKWEKLETADFISLPQKKDFVKESGATDAEKLEKAKGIYEAKPTLSETERPTPKSLKRQRAYWPTLSFSPQSARRAAKSVSRCQPTL